MAAPGEKQERVRFTAAQVGCLVAGALVVVALLSFLALPFVLPRTGWRGPVTAGRIPKNAAGTRLPSGFHAFAVSYGGRPSTAYVLRIGPLYWGAHLPR